MLFPLLFLFSSSHLSLLSFLRSTDPLLSPYCTHFPLLLLTLLIRLFFNVRSYTIPCFLTRLFFYSHSSLLSCLRSLDPFFFPYSLYACPSSLAHSALTTPLSFSPVYSPLFPYAFVFSFASLTFVLSLISRPILLSLLSLFSFSLCSYNPPFLLARIQSPFSSTIYTHAPSFPCLFYSSPFPSSPSVSSPFPFSNPHPPTRALVTHILPLQHSTSDSVAFSSGSAHSRH